jgi:LysR family transcriptional regulator, hydrogen peroxide-inducible genes activator
MPTITQLQYIVTVDRIGHFGKAALACHISQPTLSQQIREVEESLKIILFDRSKKPVIATDAGKQLIEQAKLILREHDRLLEMSTSKKGVVSGTFRLGIIPTLSSSVLPLFLDAFSKKHPKVQLSIEEMKTESIVKGLSEESLDAGILVTPLEEKKFFERPLFYEEFLLYFSKNHPLAKQKKVSEKSLTGKDLWLLQDGHCFRNQVLRICSLRGKPLVYENVRFESGNLETLRQLIQKGEGYTLLPELSARLIPAEELKDHVRSFESPVPHREVSLVFRRDQWKRPIINALEEAIISSLPGDIQKKKSKNPLIVEVT